MCLAERSSTSPVVEVSPPPARCPGLIFDHGSGQSHADWRPTSDSDWPYASAIPITAAARKHLLIIKSDGCGASTSSRSGLDRRTFWNRLLRRSDRARGQVALKHCCGVMRRSLMRWLQFEFRIRIQIRIRLDSRSTEVIKITVT